MPEPQVLSQDEIDALLHGPAAAAPAASAAPELAAYDFARHDHRTRARMPALNMVGERFARFLRRSLFTVLRRTADVSVAPTTLEKFGDYVATLQLPTSLNIVKLPPLQGSGLVVIDPKLAFASLDTLFGGKGRRAKIEGREFTAIETRVIEMMLAQAFESLVEAWSTVARIQVEPVSTEINPHFANIVSANEVVAVTRVRVELEGGIGDLHVTLPYAMLEPVQDQLDAIAGRPAPADPQWARMLRTELDEVDVEVCATLGTVTLPLGRFGRLAPGDTIECDFRGQATLSVEGIPFLRGTLAQMQGRKVLKVDRIVAGE